MGVVQELITYSVGLWGELFKGDLEFKRHMTELVDSPLAKKIQEMDDAEYLRKSQIHEAMKNKMLQIRKEYDAEISFYKDLLYINRTYDNPDTRRDILEEHPLAISPQEHAGMRQRIQEHLSKEASM